ncbi:zinc finger and BTB domain-containing protein 12-like isoform X2 [Brienomyrus brachyistius]|uniref:zinc finger and BTB domain-containing protein 12-like isoform X2 n=1 Tax=Brienomyrus brachyistius TaxID=42636 RepID=UPI0020B261E6|nr:zinc finger and BTB domain-containing protein 12-like isoform X2 [Brienomyrus brachyistius]
MELLCFRLPGHGDATLQNMNSLRTRQHFCDITIVASDQQTFRGHKVVLAACSPFLRDQFLLNPSSELQVSVLHSASVVCQLLQSCYTGILQFSTKEIVNYLTAASYLQMENVVEKCRGALSQYLQPRTPSPSGVKPSGPTEEFHEEEEREDYEVFQVCIEEDEEGDEEKRREEDDDGVVSLDNHFQETVRGKTGDEGEEEIAEHVVGRMEREGYRIWRRRHGEQRGGRARGLRHKRRNTSREMGFSGPHYPDNWHIPTPDEIMGSFGLVHSDFNQGGIKSASVGYISSCDLGQSGTEQLTQVPYGISDVQGESVVEEQGLGDSPAHFRLEESGRGQAMGLTSAREESESVAVVGSTSSSGGPISCDPCGLTFPSAESLTLHARSVHPLFVCPRCGKQFNHASNLNRHMAIHRGTKSHRCHLCHKTFTQKSTLCDHMNLHSGERPHRCSYCHVRFAHKPALRRHLKEQHGKTTAQNCMEAQRERDRERDEGGV